MLVIVLWVWSLSVKGSPKSIARATLNFLFNIQTNHLFLLCLDSDCGPSVFVSGSSLVGQEIHIFIILSLSELGFFLEGSTLNETQLAVTGWLVAHLCMSVLGKLFF